ncbi:3-oxoacyl-ACP reductase [Aeromicrobium sp. PE09-221]|uniref:SDR family NAD(P)-dependent oxidoreductase n=1 Tax=Aeromicrobium sp. PE09-221 TaxID=1898043 RepID=UPI000B3ED632|nr:SDR family NAD(P)-dependent oxidoreductase [Aeromicrobium sp. PE09-221]OUZ09696.1 3-oxoacyl-ACP reductase [Aeromicrobium sp. PE09-221]
MNPSSSAHPGGEHRTVLVTGGSRGIGAQIVRRLAERGVQVGASFNSSPQQAEELAVELGDRVAPVHYRLGSESSARDAVSAMTSTFGGLDAVIVNAGFWKGGLIERVSHEEWWSVIDANVSSLSYMARAVLPSLRQAKDPSIVLVASVVGLIGHAGDTAYGAAKAAMVGFARSLAKEVGRDGIRVNVLAPGFVDTDMTSAVPDTARERIYDETVLRRFGTADEIAKAAVFLSEDATYCTGSVLSVDGGWSL